MKVLFILCDDEELKIIKITPYSIRYIIITLYILRFSEADEVAITLMHLFILADERLQDGNVAARSTPFRNSLPIYVACEQVLFCDAHSARSRASSRCFYNPKYLVYAPFPIYDTPPTNHFGLHVPTIAPIAYSLPRYVPH